MWIGTEYKTVVATYYTSNVYYNLGGLGVAPLEKHFEFEPPEITSGVPRPEIF